MQRPGCAGPEAGGAGSPRAGGTDSPRAGPAEDYLDDEENPNPDTTGLAEETDSGLGGTGAC